MRVSNEIRSFGFFQIVVLVLSLYAFGALVLDLFLQLPPQTSKLLQRFDFIVCAVFFWDFVRQFREAENKVVFMKYGWIDLVASIPAVDFLRWGRVFRVVRILRLLRAIRGTQKLWRLFRAREALGGSVALTAFLLIVTTSMAILVVERGEQALIRTAGDALWWSLTTATTVGYGDLYPVTPEGRLIGALLMVGGVGLFGSFTALVASWFTGRDETEKRASDLMLEELKNLRLEVQALRQKLEE